MTAANGEANGVANERLEPPGGTAVLAGRHVARIGFGVTAGQVHLDAETLVLLDGLTDPPS